MVISKNERSCFKTEEEWWSVSEHWDVHNTDLVEVVVTDTDDATVIRNNGEVEGAVVHSERHWVILIEAARQYSRRQLR